MRENCKRKLKGKRKIVVKLYLKRQSPVNCISVWLHDSWIYEFGVVAVTVLSWQCLEKLIPDSQGLPLKLPTDIAVDH